MSMDGPDGIVVELYRNGFTCIEAFADRAEVRDLRGLMFPAVRRALAKKSELCVDIVPPSDGTRGRVMQFYRISYFVPQLRSHPVFLRLRDLAKTILGEGAVYTWDATVIHTAHSRKGTPWHQDAAFDPRAGQPTFLPCGMSFWLSLTRTSLRSSCLSYVARSHQGDLLPHRREDEHSLSMTVDERRFRPVDCIAPCGTLLIHQLKTWHRSQANPTSLARAAWTVNFNS